MPPRPRLIMPPLNKVKNLLKNFTENFMTTNKISLGIKSIINITNYKIMEYWIFEFFEEEVRDDWLLISFDELSF